MEIKKIKKNIIQAGHVAVEGRVEQENKKPKEFKGFAEGRSK